jgi:cation-transporting ATPase 13A1
MKQGYRVLALAYKKLNKPGTDIGREAAEKDLTFAGLLILTCPIKHDTPLYIKHLAQADYKNIMITGDNMYTAAKTGQMLNFGPSNNLFLKQASDSSFFWEDINDKLHCKVVESETAKLAQDFCLCVEGGSMKALFNNGNPESRSLFETIIMQTIIFARVSPNQKEQIIGVLKDHGKGVLMCGDGTNDVGALKKSDVGIALVGLKDEPTKAMKKAEKDRKAKIRKEAMMKRDRSLL